MLVPASTSVAPTFHTYVRPHPPHAEKPVGQHVWKADPDHYVGCRPDICPDLQGERLFVFTSIEPRALPRAMLCRPFRASDSDIPERPWILSPAPPPQRIRGR